MGNDRTEFEKRYKVTEEEKEVLEKCEVRIRHIFKNYDLFRLSYYLDSNINQEEIRSILSNNDISLEEALYKIDLLFKNFELTDTKNKIFIWKKEQ